MPSDPLQSLIAQGLAHHQAGHLQQAEAIYRQVLARDPNHHEAIHLLGALAHLVGKYDDAIQLIGRAITIAPNLAHYHHNYAEACRESGNFAEAEQAYRRAIVLTPDGAPHYACLAMVLRSLRRTDEAIAAGRKAIELDPNLPAAYLNLANALSDRRLADEAIVCYQRALELAPDHPQFLTSFGTALAELGRLDEALGCFDRAIAKHDYPHAHVSRAMVRLLRGDFEQGWDEYEWRRRDPGFPSARMNAPKPQWNGSDLAGKTILLFCEQGTGDVIQFIRYAPMVAARGARVIAYCDNPFKSLLAGAPGIDQVVGWDDAPPAFDEHIPLLSLPRLFRTRADNIPASVPYLRPDPDKAEQWRTRLSDAPGLMVGLAWTGTPTHPNNHNRSTSLAQLAPLAAVPNVRWFSLQKGPAAEQTRNPPPGMNLIDLTEHLHDFSDTAAMIANLDLVITVDTAVAHIAGALGKPLWVLLAFMPDFRWLLDREDCPWYPSAKLFRQKQAGDWDTVVKRVVEELGRFGVRDER